VGEGGVLGEKVGGLVGAVVVKEGGIGEGG